MSLDNVFGRVQSLSNTVQGGANLLSRAANLLGAGAASGAGAPIWANTLRPASFRGIKFGVLEGTIKFGRKMATQEGAKRDGQWQEDSGRMAREFTLKGFLIGDDCIAQRDALIKACEDPAAVTGSELVHPSLGSMQVSLMSAVTCSEKWSSGRYFEIDFSFVEQGKRDFPSVNLATADQVFAASGLARLAAFASFSATVFNTLKAGAAVATQVASSVKMWSGVAQHIVNDATNLYHFVQSLPGEFGRLFGGNTVRSRAITTSVPDLIAAGAVARFNVVSASQSLGSAAGGLMALASAANHAIAAGASGLAGNTLTSSLSNGNSVLDDFVSKVHDLAQTVAAAAPSGQDALRLLVSLIEAAPVLSGALPAPVYPVSAIVPIPAAQAVALAASATSDLFRRAAVIVLAEVAARYEPISFDDAAAVRALVTEQLDREIRIAGDQGQDASYDSLQALRAAIVQDLAQRGANLATSIEVATVAPLPALVLAQRLYRTAERADQLIDEADPVHPAFMPINFRALAN